MAIDEKRYKIIDSEQFPLSKKTECYAAMKFRYPHLMGKGLTAYLDVDHYTIVQSKEIARQCAEAEAKKM